MSIAGLASGKRCVSASGNATTDRSTTSAHGLPSVSYSNGSSIQSSSYQPLSTRTCSPLGSVASATKANFASNASATWRTEAAEELVSDCACGSLGNRAEEVAAAGSHAAGRQCERQKARNPRQRC